MKWENILNEIGKWGEYKSDNDNLFNIYDEPSTYYVLGSGEWALSKSWKVFAFMAVTFSPERLITTK